MKLIKQNLAMAPKYSTAVEKLVIDFTWGPIEAIHVFGQYVILEYHPQIFKSSAGTGKYAERVVNYAPFYYQNHKWIDPHSHYETMDEAIASAVAHKWEGENGRADRYFLKMIGAI